MKPSRNLLRFLALAGSAICFPACITHTKTTTAPDGTVTVEKITAPSGEALNAAVAGAGILAPVLRDK